MHAAFQTANFKLTEILIKKINNKEKNYNDDHLYLLHFGIK